MRRMHSRRFGRGSGAGLAIVRDIAEAWGGAFDIRATQDELEAVLRLPG